MENETYHEVELNIPHYLVADYQFLVRLQRWIEHILIFERGKVILELWINKKIRKTTGSQTYINRPQNNITIIRQPSIQKLLKKIKNIYIPAFSIFLKWIE